MNRSRTERGNREHRFVSDHLSAYIDEQLGNHDRLRVETHLSTCAECRADLHSLRWTQCLLQKAPAIKIPRSFVLREVDVAPRPAPGARLRLLTVQWATAAVALLFVLVLGVDLLNVARPHQAVQREAAMLMATAPQAAEVVVETTIVEKEQMAPKAGAPLTTEAGTAQDEPTADASPTSEPAALMAQPEDEDGTSTPISTEESMRAAVPEGTPTPAPAAAAPEETSTSAATEEARGAEMSDPSLEQRNLAPDDKSTMPPQPEQDGTQVEVYGLGEQRVEGRIAWRVAEVILGVALLILVGTLIWLRQRT